MVYPRVSNDLLHRVTRAAESIMQICKSVVNEAEVFCPPGYKTPRMNYPLLASCLSVLHKSYSTSSQRHMLKSLFPTEPSRPRETCLSSARRDPSFAWVFAVTILIPDYLAEIADVSHQEIRVFSLAICQEFYRRTASLLKKAKETGRDKEDRLTLNENLTTLLYLISGPAVTHRIVERLGKAVTRSNDHQPHRPSSQETVHSLQDPELDFEKDLAAQKQTNINGATVRDGAFLDEFKGAMNKEGWAHLRQYTQHWLVKLEGEGPGFNDQAFVKICHLDTMCRIHYNLETKGLWQLPPVLLHKKVYALIKKADLLSHIPTFSAVKLSGLNFGCFQDVFTVLQRRAEAYSKMGWSCYDDWWRTTWTSILLDTIDKDIENAHAQ